MWNEPMPKWRTARKQYQCHGDGCAKVIAPGERYLDRTVRHPANLHLRYCQECAEPVLERAKNYHGFRGRNDFPDRYQQVMSSPQWESLKRKVIEQRGNRCERCGQESASLELHHVHYRSLGSEQPEDVELLCRECHTGADEARQAKGRPKRDDPQEGLIVGIDGDHWGKFDSDTIYIPLPGGRYLPVNAKRKARKEAAANPSKPRRKGA
jgi:5-methylcytosine-specific restriction endonuclease McrA